MRLMVLVLAGLLLVGCRSQSATHADPTPDDEVRWLIDKTLRDLAYVQGGSFMMGDYLKEPFPDESGPSYWTPSRNNKYPHKVTLDGFHIQRHEVTFQEYDIYSRAQGLPLVEESLIGDNEGIARIRKPNKPVTLISWHEARAYCRWLGEQTGLPFDLPTEAQWEYAARSRGRYVGFATDTGLYEKGRNFPPFERYGHEVGKYPPNPLGLYDMSGNVDEWVLDWYAEDYYRRSPERNPRGPGQGTKKVVRGGSYLEDPGGATVYGRKALKPDARLYIQGFRCVVNVSEPLPQAHVPDPSAFGRLVEKPPYRGSK